jgi:hypothetical protein
LCLSIGWDTYSSSINHSVKLQVLRDTSKKNAIDF